MSSLASACSVCEVHAESTFVVEGMDCREEVALIERRFRNLPGLEAFDADVMARRLHVKYDAARLSTAAIAAAVADAGMRAWLDHEEPVVTADSRESGLRTFRLVVSGAALGAGLTIALAPEATTAVPRPTLSAVLYAIALALGLPAPLRKARQAIKVGVLDINVLMIVAAAGAVALGEWAEAAAVVFLFAVAQALEVRTLERARHAVRALMELVPSQVLVRRGEEEQLTPIDDVTIGDVMVLRPGDKVPLDGLVVSGASAVNQAPVTGESLPIDKGTGDEVFAGTINGRGALDVRVTKLRRDSTLTRIVHLVEQAQAQRAPAQALVERFARIYTPSVLALSLAIVVVPLLTGGDWRVWLYRALVLLVVSCPCALVISTPVSVVAALAGAARRGVLIKGGVHLERAASIRCLAFDKTGTLTLGQADVLDIQTFGAARPADVLAVAAAVERRSEHPIAQAIVQHARRHGAAGMVATDVHALPGRGAEGMLDGRPILVGNPRLFEERGLHGGLTGGVLAAAVARVAEAGRTPVIVSRDGTPIGVIAVADRPRPAARDALDVLRRDGIAHLVMLTGDSEATARAVARELGIDQVRAGLLPEDKVDAVRELRARYGTVAMVGDGVNDAPALALADIGVAMGAAGSNAALETADVALMSDDLLKIPYALRLSRSTLRNIQANLAISLVLKGTFVIAALAGVATLWMAVLADTGASVIVIANALRLLRAD
ncbi:MAG: heavy metal translocating P-type ATPase [Vicinamibacterales bacterium]